MQPPTPEEIAAARAVLEREERWKAAMAVARKELATASGPLVFVTPGQPDQVEHGDRTGTPTYVFCGPLPCVGSTPR